MSERNNNDEQDIEKKKYVEFYSQSYASFYTTTMEKDKSILAVSAGGIGFLITLINFTKEIEVFEYIIFIFASLAFISAIFTIIHIFGKNAEYIISLTTEADDCDEKECKLKILDKVATYGFSIGIVLSLTLGAMLSYQNISMEVRTVSKKEVTSQANESVAGATLIKKIFSGASQVKPKVNTQASDKGAGTNTSSSTSKGD